MMSPVIAIPVILLMSSSVSTDPYVEISKIPNDVNKQNSQVDAKNISNGDFNNIAIANDFDAFGEDSKFGVDVARKDSNLDDDIKSDLMSLKLNQLTHSNANSKNAVANGDTLSDARIEALRNDFEKFGEGSKIGVDIARKDLILDDDRTKWNQITNSQANTKNKAANEEFSDAHIEANDFQTFREGSKFSVDVARKYSKLDDDRPNWNQLTNSQATAMNTAANEEFSDAQIEATEKDLETFGENGVKFDTYISKNSNLGDDKEIEIPNWIKRVKRDFEYVWDNCPGKTSLQFVDDVLKCLPDDDQAGLGDRVFEPLQNGSCPAEQRRVQLGRATVCIEDRRRRKNG